MAPSTAVVRVRHRCDRVLHLAHQPRHRRLVSRLGENTHWCRSPRVLHAQRTLSTYRPTSGDVRLHGVHNRLSGIDSSAWDWGGIEAYRNPPFYALLYVPTAAYSYYTSFLIWTAIGVALLALSVVLLKPERPGRLFLWAVAFYPVFADQSVSDRTRCSAFPFSWRFIDSSSKSGQFAAGLVAGLLWFKPPLLIGLFVLVGVLSTATFPLLARGRCHRVRHWRRLSWLALPASVAGVRQVAAKRTSVTAGNENMWNKHTPRAFFEMLLPEMGRHDMVVSTAHYDR